MCISIVLFYFILRRERRHRSIVISSATFGYYFESNEKHYLDVVGSTDNNHKTVFYHVFPS